MCNGVVGHAFGLCKDESILVGITTPAQQNLISQLYQTRLFAAAQTDDTHGPLNDAGLHILETSKDNLTLDRRALHGEAVVATLEVLVAEDTAAYDGEARSPVRLSQVYALRGERGLCGTYEPPRPPKPAHYSSYHRR